MESYTIEDIEILRKKSGMSYQEAVALLDYHNGHLARALIDLEKHGRLTEEPKEKEGKATMNDKKLSDTKDKALNIIQKLYRSRVKIRKKDTPVMNVSVLFSALCLLFAPHMTIAGIIVSMILGYQFSFSRMDPEFASENLEKMVKRAAQNAKSSVSSVVHTFSGENREKQTDNTGTEPDKTGMKENATSQSDVKETSDDRIKDAAESLKHQAKELEETMDSFFESNSSATNRNSAYSAATSSVPTIQVPVQTETKDGEVTQEDDQDGYSSVTIG